MYLSWLVDYFFARKFLSFLACPSALPVSVIKEAGFESVLYFYYIRSIVSFWGFGGLGASVITF